MKAAKMMSTAATTDTIQAEQSIAPCTIFTVTTTEYRPLRTSTITATDMIQPQHEPSRDVCRHNYRHDSTKALALTYCLPSQLQPWFNQSTSPFMKFTVRTTDMIQPEH